MKQRCAACGRDVDGAIWGRIILPGKPEPQALCFRCYRSPELDLTRLGAAEV